MRDLKKSKIRTFKSYSNEKFEIIQKYEPTKISCFTVVSNIHVHVHVYVIARWSKALNLLTWLYIAHAIGELYMFVAWKAIHVL